MFFLKPINGIHFLFIFLRVVINNGESPSKSVTECLDILKNVFEDERRIREYFHENTDILRNEDTCENPETELTVPTTDIPLGKFPNCAELQKSGVKKSGVYTIYPKGSTNETGIEVYCNLKTDGGGWIVIQRRGWYPGRQVDFNRNWAEFAAGFGNLKEEFWLGNDNIHILTMQEEVKLRIDLRDFRRDSRFAEYDYMEVGDEESLYNLTLGIHSGNTLDSMSFQNHQPFSTWDNRPNVSDCNVSCRSAWWYKDCDFYTQASLNGVYKESPYDKDVCGGITWFFWHGMEYSLKETEMKIRPRNFLQ